MVMPRPVKCSCAPSRSQVGRTWRPCSKTAAYFSSCARARPNSSRQRGQTASTPAGALAAINSFNSPGSASNGVNPSPTSRQQTGQPGRPVGTSDTCTDSSIISDTSHQPLVFSTIMQRNTQRRKGRQGGSRADSPRAPKCYKLAAGVNLKSSDEGATDGEGTDQRARHLPPRAGDG